MSKKAWIIFGVVVVLLFGVLVYVSSKGKIDVKNVDTNKIQPASQQSGDIADHVFGKKDSKIVLVEYGDFQCPGCAGAYPNLKTISEKYKDKIAFVFRNFPLTSIHPNARAAAAAAEAAGLEGKYWEMHDILYTNQKNWQSSTVAERTPLFAGYAKEVGIDNATFEKALTSLSINEKISFDQALGRKINVSATPTILLNGEKLSDEISNDIIQSDGAKLEALIEAKL